MPEEGIKKRLHEEMLSEEEMILAVSVAADLGISKVRITGGEPLVKRNILSIARGIASVPGIREVCITTNGTLLPSLAKPLREAGVQRVNISLDTLDREKYAFITRRDALDQALSGIEAALSAGFDRVKINSVLIGGFNDHEIPALADLTRRYPVDVRFIELMPMHAYPFGPEAFIPGDTVLQALPDLVKEDLDGSIARLYRLPDAFGSIGIISPLSCAFCDRCDRIRLTADGKIKPCLHSSTELSVKGLDKEGMRRQFEAAVQMKPERHALLSYTEQSDAGRTMNRIGG